MCSKSLGADMVFAWPTAEVAVMGSDGAVNIIFKNDIDKAEDKAAMRQKILEEYSAESRRPTRRPNAASSTMSSNRTPPGSGSLTPS